MKLSITVMLLAFGTCLLLVGVDWGAMLRGSFDTNPAGLPVAQLSSVPQGIAVNGRAVYVPLWQGGLLILDVRTDPVAIDETATLATDLAVYKAALSADGSMLLAAEAFSTRTSASSGVTP